MLPTMPRWAFAAFILGGLWMCLWNGRVRRLPKQGEEPTQIVVISIEPIPEAGERSRLTIRGHQGRFPGTGHTRNPYCCMFSALRVDPCEQTFTRRRILQSRWTQFRGQNALIASHGFALHRVGTKGTGCTPRRRLAIVHWGIFFFVAPAKAGAAKLRPVVPATRHRVRVFSSERVPFQTPVFRITTARFYGLDVIIEKTN